MCPTNHWPRQNAHHIKYHLGILHQMKDDISDKNQIQSMDVKTWVLILMLLFKETFPKQTRFQIFLEIDCKLYIHSMFHLMLNVDKLDYFLVL